MAVLGYCRVCDRLVNITPHAYKLGTREREWKPIDHEGVDGKPCPGVRRAV